MMFAEVSLAVPLAAIIGFGKDAADLPNAAKIAESETSRDRVIALEACKAAQLIPVCKLVKPSCGMVLAFVERQNALIRPLAFDDIAWRSRWLARTGVGEHARNTLGRKAFLDRLALVVASDFCYKRAAWGILK